MAEEEEDKEERTGGPPGDADGIIRVPSGKRGEFILATKVCDSYAFIHGDVLVVCGCFLLYVWLK